MKQNILLLNIFSLHDFNYHIEFDYLEKNHNLTKSLLLDIQLASKLSWLPTVGLVD